MRVQPSHVLVGAFVVGLGGVALAVGLWLASGGVSLVPRQRYVARFDESVSGLGRGAPVKYRGVPVGTVREMAVDQVDPDRVRVVLEVSRGTPITTDTVAALTFQGLTGMAAVDLSGGGRGAPPLGPTPGEPYPVIRTVPSTMKRLEDGVTALLGELGQTARSANALLDGETRGALRGTAADVHEVARTLSGRSGEIDAAIRDAAGSLHQAHRASERLPSLVARLGRGADAVERAAEELERVGVSTRAAVGDASGTVHEANRVVQQLNGESLVELHRLLVEMSDAAAALDRVARELARNQGALLGGQQPQRGPGE